MVADPLRRSVDKLRRELMQAYAQPHGPENAERIGRACAALRDAVSLLNLRDGRARVEKPELAREIVDAVLAEALRLVRLPDKRSIRTYVAVALQDICRSVNCTVADRALVGADITTYAANVRWRVRKGQIPWWDDKVLAAVRLAGEQKMMETPPCSADENSRLALPYHRSRVSCPQVQPIASATR